jgi:cystathionine gamma-lyase
MKVITLAESLGGVESLIQSPPLMTHYGLSAETKKELGLSEN